MTDKPILFSAQMVRAILEGHKTQTRRVVKQKQNPHDFLGGINDSRNDPYSYGFENPEFLGNFITLPEQRCPHGRKGDHLWIRENFWQDKKTGEIFGYCADDEWKYSNNKTVKKTPSIHMPRWASRITLEITGIRVERLQDISEEDALAEGFASDGDESAKIWYSMLWDKINGIGSWDKNPFVWVIEFKVLEIREN
jgi:uncharacterized protein YhfF